MNPKFTYLVLLLAAFIVPFVLSFDKKVAYYKKWKYLFPAMIWPILLFLAWDIVFTYWFVWNFNENYVVGIRYFGLPIEEILFFFVVPFSSLFIYECVFSYFPKLKNSNNYWILFRIIALILLVTGAYNYQHIYTFTAFVFCGLYMEYIIYNRKSAQNKFNVPAFLVAYGFILLPFLVMNGLLTALPVVQYDNSETTGLRIFTIPIEDVFFGMLLIMMIASGYEKWIERKP